LNSIPECINLLKQLQILCLDNNSITNIPRYISELKQLNTISLAYNRVTSLEYESVVGCEFLKQICISFNKELKYVDYRIFDMPNMSSIRLINTGLSKEYMCNLADYLMTSPTIVSFCIDGFMY
jgi:Leucine-rich repeat (LRR) protein